MKRDKYDVIALEGYTFLSQCRKQKYLRKNGDIGVFIKDDIFPHVTVIESDSDYIRWFKISKLLLKTDEDFVFGAIYVPYRENHIIASGQV